MNVFCIMSPKEVFEIKVATFALDTMYHTLPRIDVGGY